MQYRCIDITWHPWQVSQYFMLHSTVVIQKQDHFCQMSPRLPQTWVNTDGLRKINWTADVSYEINSLLVYLLWLEQIFISSIPFRRSIYLRKGISGMAVYYIASIITLNYLSMDIRKHSMLALLSWQGCWYHVQDPQDIPRVFQRSFFGMRLPSEMRHDIDAV